MMKKLPMQRRDSKVCLHFPSAFCRKPDPPQNGQVIGDKNTYDVGENVSFSCSDTYTLNGSATVTCQNDATWSADTPECEASTGNYIFPLFNNIKYQCQRLN